MTSNLSPNTYHLSPITYHLSLIKVAGFQKNSFVDWPGKICSVIFLGGCNFDCYYCHNRDILCGTSNKIPLTEVLPQIKEQIGFIDGVCISGGEPTVHPHLREIIMAVRALGLPVKLDTNGSNFNILKQLVEDGLVDFVAMDIKAPLEKYEQIVGPMENGKWNMEDVRKSIEFLKNWAQSCAPTSHSKLSSFSSHLSSAPKVQFRTTPCPELTENDFDEIKKLTGRVRWVKNHFITPNA